MSVTPETIEKQLFTQRFRGYDQGEVDRFLDRVSGTLSALTAERDELAAERDQLVAERDQLAAERDRLAGRVRELEESGGDVADSEKLLQRTLVVAQRTADETVHDARATAEQTLADARAEAEEVLADARRQAAAEHERARRVGARIRSAVEDFARFRSDLRERFEAAVAEQLAVLDRTELPDLPDGLANLDDLDGEEAGGGEPAYGSAREHSPADAGEPGDRARPDHRAARGGDPGGDSAAEDRAATADLEQPPGEKAAEPDRADDRPEPEETDSAWSRDRSGWSGAPVPRPGER